MTDPKEVSKWKQYYIDQRARILIDPDLSDDQKKLIREAIAAYEWREDRPILIKEPINDAYEP